MTSPALDIILRGGYEGARRKFAQDFARIMGSAPVAGYLTHKDDGLISADPWNGGTWTADASMAGQISSQGRGYTRAFASASSRYLTRPDAANQSFGNGVTDSAFWLFALVNVTDTAAGRTIISKDQAGHEEWRFNFNLTDSLSLSLIDNSVPISAARASNAAITQGALHTFWAFYDGTGGVTAANGITLGMDSAVIASTAANQPSYVAMENKDAPVVVGTDLGIRFFDGAIGLAAVGAGASSLAIMTAATALCTQYFGAP